MRVGFLSGQTEALRAAYAEQRRRLTRRGWILAGVSSAAMGACGFVAGRRTPEPKPTTAQDTPLYALALGPLDELRRQAMHIEGAFLVDPSNPTLCTAIQRLFTLALAEPADEALARRLLRLGKVAGAPAHVVEAAGVLATTRRR